MRKSYFFQNIFKIVKMTTPQHITKHVQMFFFRIKDAQCCAKYKIWLKSLIDSLKNELLKNLILDFFD